jgi:hypothetical protein
VSLSRRQLTAGIAGLAGLSACAPVALPPRREVLVNLADLQPAPPELDDSQSAQLASGADQALRMTVPVRLNGEGPFDFVVDTGANHSVVAAELAQALRLPAGPNARVHGIAGVEPAPTAVIGRLEIGEVLARRVRAPILAQARLGAGGLLGVDVLKNRRVTMDFAKNELQIAPSAIREEPKLSRGVSPSRLKELAPSDATEVKVPARYRFGQLIIIDAQVGPHPVTAFLDSGSQNTVGNMALGRLVMGDPGLVAQSIEVRLISATGQTASGKLSPIPTLRLGGLRIGNMSAVFADLHVFDIWDLLDTPAILIGVDIMRHFQSIELDFGKRMVTFRTPPGRPTAPPAP